MSSASFQRFYDLGVTQAFWLWVEGWMKVFVCLLPLGVPPLPPPLSLLFLCRGSMGKHTGSPPDHRGVVMEAATSGRFISWIICFCPISLLPLPLPLPLYRGYTYNH